MEDRPITLLEHEELLSSRLATASTRVFLGELLPEQIRKSQTSTNTLRGQKALFSPIYEGWTNIFFVSKNVVSERYMDRSRLIVENHR